MAATATPTATATVAAMREQVKDQVRQLLVGKEALERSKLVAGSSFFASASAETHASPGAAWDTLRQALATPGRPWLLEPAGTAAVLTEEAPRDLGLLQSSDPRCPSVLDAVCRARLLGGRAVLSDLLSRPISDAALLSGRQAALRAAEAAAASSGADARLVEMASLEPDVAWLFRARGDDSLRALYDIAYFRMWVLRGLNRSPAALTASNLYRIVASPLIGLLSPVVYFVLPYVVLRFKLGVKLPFAQYLRMMLRSIDRKSVV